MAFCSNCGNKIEDGANFCKGCGEAINRSSIAQTTGQQKPIQTAQQSENNQIIKQGFLSYNTSLLKSLKGVATLYNDRLEWKSENGMTVVINTSDILNSEISTIKQNLTIYLSNSQKHVFSKTLTSGDVLKQVAFGYLGTGNVITLLSEWQTAINMTHRHI